MSRKYLFATIVLASILFIPLTYIGVTSFQGGFYDLEDSIYPISFQIVKGSVSGNLENLQFQDSIEFIVQEHSDGRLSIDLIYEIAMSLEFVLGFNLYAQLEQHSNYDKLNFRLFDYQAADYKQLTRTNNSIGAKTINTTFSTLDMVNCFYQINSTHYQFRLQLWNEKLPFDDGSTSWDLDLLQIAFFTISPEYILYPSIDVEFQREAPIQSNATLVLNLLHGTIDQINHTEIFANSSLQIVYVGAGTFVYEYLRNQPEVVELQLRIYLSDGSLFHEKVILTSFKNYTSIIESPKMEISYQNIIPVESFSNTTIELKNGTQKLFNQTEILRNDSIQATFFGDGQFEYIFSSSIEEIYNITIIAYFDMGDKITREFLIEFKNYTQTVTEPEMSIIYTDEVPLGKNATLTLQLRNGTKDFNYTEIYMNNSLETTFLGDGEFYFNYTSFQEDVFEIKIVSIFTNAEQMNRTIYTSFVNYTQIIFKPSINIVYPSSITKTMNNTLKIGLQNGTLEEFNRTEIYVNGNLTATYFGDGLISHILYIENATQMNVTIKVYLTGSEVIFEELEIIIEILSDEDFMRNFYSQITGLLIAALIIGITMLTFILMGVIVYYRRKIS